MSKEHNLDRRCFLSVAAGLAAGSLGTIPEANAQAIKAKPASLPKIFPGRTLHSRP